MPWWVIRRTRRRGFRDPALILRRDSRLYYRQRSILDSFAHKRLGRVGGNIWTGDVAIARAFA